MKPLRAGSPVYDLFIEKADRAYEHYLAKGMPLADYPGETIQCRNELDRTNWLGLTKLCEKAIADEKAYYEAQNQTPPALLGDYPIAAPGIRCTSNAFIRPTVAQTLVLMDQVLNYALAAQAYWWGLKDTVRECKTVADLEAVDMTGGWP